MSVILDRLKEWKEEASGERNFTAAREACQKSDMPVLRGRVVGRLIYVHCPYCDTEHIHSWQLGNTKPEMRWPHCGKESPIRDRFYFIAPYRKNSRLAGSRVAL